MRIVRTVLFAIFVAGCTQEQPSITLRSLESTGELAFVCVTEDDGKFVPHSIDECPEDDPDKDQRDPTLRRLLTLATQATRGEVAVIETPGKSAGVEVVDSAPTVPGFNFLPVGAQPGDIVSTPGGVASFVGVGEVGKEGIFALPTRCLGPQGKGEPPRDLTTWPACRLPGPPGDMAVLIDSVEGRTSCDQTAAPPVLDEGGAAASLCGADLTQELEPPGRRKLAVALRDRAELWVIDAQWLLDRAPGTYEPCVPEHRILLRADLPDSSVPQLPPPDLDFTGCELPGLNHGPLLEEFQSIPAGFATLEEAAHRPERLFIADVGAPVIHVVDVADPCNLRELPPLLPQSFIDPARVVTTKRLAVSPATTAGQRYLYAIDERDNGSVMIFDVSVESATRTPLLRPRSALFPFEPPDRIAFDAPVQDVTFFRRDRTEPDPVTGEAPVGVLCDPDVNNTDPSATAHRPSGDFSRGARPTELRGLFGALALDTGQVAIIDVEDYDAPCRRPIFTNTESTEDFRGCAGDPPAMQGRFYTVDPQNPNAKPTVTNEVSCRVVEPHRARSASFLISNNELGVRAPALRAFPRLTSPLGRTLPTDDSDEGRDNPKMLAVDFAPNQPAEVFVGTTLYRRPPEGESIQNELVIDPATAQTSSLALSLKEPRAYAPGERFVAEYEGLVVTERPAARFEYTGGADAKLVDSSALFCDRGVQDEYLAARMGQDVGATDLERFKSGHADYIILTSDLVDSDNKYWEGVGATCGGADPKLKGAGFIECRSNLGTREAPTPLRELRILSSTNAELVVEPRPNASAAQRAKLLELLGCCFPEPVSYEVRASRQWVLQGSLSGFRHNVRFNPDLGDAGRCDRDCNPLRAGFQSRAIEVSCRPGACPLADDGQPAFGVATDDDVACVVEEAQLGPGGRLDPTHPCVFRNLTTNFAIYRGRLPGREIDRVGTAFSWEVIGGFNPLMIDLRLTETGPSTTPQSVVYSPQTDSLILADGATKGVVFVNLSEGFNTVSIF